MNAIPRVYKPAGETKRYEWAAAFGLVFTVMRPYLKILDLLVHLSSREEKIR